MSTRPPRMASGVAAVVALDRVIETSRAGRYTPAHSGPVTIDDEVIEIARQIVELERPEGVDSGDR
jgi:hypothetical protein